MYKAFFKRLIDIVLSALGIIVLAIPMLIIAVIIKIDDPGPALFKQKRVGTGLFKLFCSFHDNTFCFRSCVQLDDDRTFKITMTKKSTRTAKISDKAIHSTAKPPRTVFPLKFHTPFVYPIR